MSAADRKIFSRPHAAFLFDMDGTLLNSIAVVERVWGAWAERHGFEPEVFLKTVHGVRAVDTIRNLALPGVDAEKEADDLLQAEMEDVEGIIPIPGALDFLASLPEDRWAIVTSAPRELAHRRMIAAGIPFPKVMVAGEDVSAGKPSPECYLLGAERLGVAADQCVVFEDAVAGILAGEAAGAEVVVITTTHAGAHDTPHFSTDAYEALAVGKTAEGLLTLSRR